MIRCLGQREGSGLVSMPVLECHGLRRRFGDLVAVDGVGFQIAAGETYGLLSLDPPTNCGRSFPVRSVHAEFRQVSLGMVAWPRASAAGCG
jgi:ABC-type branched-subunit amino acid transport system ATPase component